MPLVQAVTPEDHVDSNVGVLSYTFDGVNHKFTFNPNHPMSRDSFLRTCCWLVSNGIESTMTISTKRKQSGRAV